MTAPIDRAIFYVKVRSSGLIGPTISATEFAGLQALLDAWEQRGWPSDLRYVAYTMATALHESMLDFNIREIGRGRGKQYGIPVAATGKTYYGRGPAQLTWFENYRTFAKLLGIDLVNNPDLALVPETGASILIIGSLDGLFRKGHTLGTYFNARTDDPINARDIINGDVKKNGAMIAGYHGLFLRALQAAMLPAGAPVPVAPVKVTPISPPPLVAPQKPAVTLPAVAQTGTVKTGGLWASLKSLFSKKDAA